MTAYIEVFCWWMDGEDLIRLDFPDEEYPEEATLVYTTCLTTYDDENEDADDRYILQQDWASRAEAQAQAESMAKVLGIEWHDYSRDPYGAET